MTDSNLSSPPPKHSRHPTQSFDNNRPTPILLKPVPQRQALLVVHF